MTDEQTYRRRDVLDSSLKEGQSKKGKYRTIVRIDDPIVGYTTHRSSLFLKHYCTSVLFIHSEIDKYKKTHTKR